MQGRRALSVRTKVSPVEFERIILFYRDVRTLRPAAGLATPVVVWSIRKVVEACAVSLDCTAAVARAHCLLEDPVDVNTIFNLPNLRGQPPDRAIPDFPDLLFFPSRADNRWTLSVLCHAGTISLSPPVTANQT